MSGTRSLGSAPPFNTAIAEGYNAITRANAKLGSWPEYLAMRSGILGLNREHRDCCRTLWCHRGIAFRGRQRTLPAALVGDHASAGAAWEADLAREDRRALAAKRVEDRTHTEVQGWLRYLGRTLGFDLWIAVNDRGHALPTGRLGDGCLDELPRSPSGNPGTGALRLMYVLWLKGGSWRRFRGRAHESTYSRIVRLLDVSLGAPEHGTGALFLVAPHDREARCVRSWPARIPEHGRSARAPLAVRRTRGQPRRHGALRTGLEAIARSLA